MNAKKEFLEHLFYFAKSKNDILCARIKMIDTHDLTTGWTEDDMNKFLNEIDSEYDDGYGTQFLFGNIWFKDGTWSDREDYDGSEWWEYKSCPDIPIELIRKDKEREIKLNELGL